MRGRSRRRVDAAKRLLEWLGREGRAAITKPDTHAAHQSLFQRVSDLEPVLRLLDITASSASAPHRLGRTAVARPSLGRRLARRTAAEATGRLA